MAGRVWSPDEAEALVAAVGRFGLAGRRHDLLPRPQSTVLGQLDQQGPLSITELADRVAVRHQSMRETVEALRRTGALTTARTDADRRKVICTITRRGRAAWHEDQDARTRWILDAADRLTPKQRKAALKIAGLLDRIAADDPS